MADDDSKTQELLRILIQLAARNAVPEEDIRKVVSNTTKQIRAYNLCDGSLTQAQIAKKAGLDQGNFSRTVGRWVEAGVAFKIGDSKLLHLYPLSKQSKQGPLQLSR